MSRASIDYDIARTPLGLLLVAASERGVCIVRFGDDPAAMVRCLRGEFPYAHIAADEGGRIAPWVRALVRYLEGSARELELPLDVRGSQFQRRVWDALREIPRGATRTYSEVARSIGRPRATRAVGNACNANPVAVAIPCHRVVAKGGGAGGYRWGVERKRALLRLEAGAPEGEAVAPTAARAAAAR